MCDRQVRDDIPGREKDCQCTSCLGCSSGVALGAATRMRTDDGNRQRGVHARGFRHPLDLRAKRCGDGDAECNPWTATASLVVLREINEGAARNL